MTLINAIVQRDSTTVRNLLVAGADPNAVEDDAFVTPLHFAAQYNALDIAMLLLAAGAKVHAGTYPDQQTPQDIARLFQHQDMVLLLTACQHDDQDLTQ